MSSYNPQSLQSPLVDAIIDASLDTKSREEEEAALMAAHEVSRTPVREALIHLETAGLIRRLPRKGAVLFKPTLEEFLAILEVHDKQALFF